MRQKHEKESSTHVEVQLIEVQPLISKAELESVTNQAKTSFQGIIVILKKYKKNICAMNLD